MVSLPPPVWAELDFSSVWNDISRDVRMAMVSVTRGANSESSTPGPMAGQCTLDNRHRRYSPRDPMSDLFQLIGQNTGIRYGVKAGGPWARQSGGVDDRLRTPDSAALTVAGDLDLRIEVALDEWRSAQMLALRYTTASGNNRSWALQTTDDATLIFMWSPDGLLAAREEVTSTLPVPAHRGQRLAVRVVLDINNGSGGHTVTFYTGRNVDDAEVYWTQLGTAVTGSGTTSVFDGAAPLEFGSGDEFNLDPNGGVIGRLSGTMHRLRLYDGSTLKADLDVAKGGVGAAQLTDNTGLVWTVLGATFLTNKHIRMAGEVPAWPPGRDDSGNNVYTGLEPAGINRRLGAGTKPLDSALLRYIKAQGPLECWPLTDGELATSGGSLYGSAPFVPDLGLGNVPPKWSGGSLGDWLEPTVQFKAGGNGTLRASVGNKTAAATGWSVDWFRNGTADGGGSLIIKDRGAASDANPLIEFSLVADVPAGSVLLSRTSYTEGSSSFAILANLSNTGTGDGRMHHFRLTTQVAGSNTLWSLYIDGELADNGTATGIATKAPSKLSMTWLLSSADSSSEWSSGYVTYWGATAPTAADMYQAATGFQGESAGARAQRIADEAGLTLSVAGADDGQVRMGIQRRQTVLELLETCAICDDGFFLERRDERELIYRAHTALENQAPAFVLDFPAGTIRSYKATDDDKLSVNDVTVRREGGTVNAQEILQTGRKSVLDPPDGIGRYDQAYERNVETDEIAANLAGWYLHKGTYDGFRFPKITIDLANERVHQMIDYILRADVGDIIKLTGVPGEYGPDDIDLIIRGYEEEMSQDAWRLTFACAPGAVWTIATVAGTDAAHDGPASRADLDSELAGAITATDTTFDVMCTGQTTWIDTAGFASQFPFDVRVGGVGGEVMRVTACTSTVVDAFGRTSSNGWGSADTGGAWSTGGGSASDYAVGSGYGRHTLATVNSSRRTFVSFTRPDFDAYVSLTTSATATGGFLSGSMTGRYIDSDNLYAARVEFSTANVMTLTIRKRVAATETQLGTFTLPDTYSAGTYVRIRFQASGTTLRAKAWLASGLEPGPWQVSVTDPDLTTSSFFGLRSISSSSNTNTNPEIRYDNLEVANPQVFTVTRGINGYSRAWAASDDVRLAVTPILPL